MKQIIIRTGKAFCTEVPKPIVDDNAILVKTAYSCISQGTEISGIKKSGKTKKDKIITLLKDKPKAIEKAIQIFKNEGYKSFLNKFNKVVSLNTDGTPIGYSLSGYVEEVGENVKNIKAGDFVACAGAGIANHAQYVVVPKNLTVKVPKGLELRLASTMTLGGIALQGVRRGDFKLGEFVAVLGLGVLGLITVQLLSSSGCRVIAVDIDERRCDLARSTGAEKVYNSSQNEAYIDEIMRFTNGFGVDGVIFTAATDNPEVISNAFAINKRKGKVVMVGIGGDQINRQDLYHKELDYIMSTSYGPGRYDALYEVDGIDYPYSYVRWTENRNMEEYLRLLAQKKINIDTLIEKEYDVDKANIAYEELENHNKTKPVIALFKYPETKSHRSKIELVSYKEDFTSKSLINVGIIGAGNFAKNMHMPNLKSLSDKYKIYAICDINGLNAKQTAEKFNAKIATTDYNEILDDDAIDMVLITTRHNLHAEFSIKAMNKGKAVLVEKPAATTMNELEKLKEVIFKTRMPYMVGFNRRFSPFANTIKNKLTSRLNPMIISYRMNAGFIPLDAWVHEDGGRIVGEACHIIDLCSFFTDSDIESISNDSIIPETKSITAQDNVSINIQYEDGSVANIIYVSIGNKKFPKENLEIFCDGYVYKMTDYQKLEFFGNKTNIQTLQDPDKGHRQELIEFHDYITGKRNSSPISLESILQTTKATLLVG